MEYSRHFQDNIYPEEFNTRTKGINDWIEENRDLHDWAKDPNAYEMTNVFLFAGKYISEGRGVNLENIEKMWELRSGDFERCGISENNFVYQICEQSYNAAISGNALVNDEGSHSALRKMAGIGLYLMQQQRDTGRVEYNNLHEFMDLVADSQVLKQQHPKLYKGLKFDENISRLYEMQIEHLDERSRQELKEFYNSHTSSKEEKEDNDVDR